jgi:hypothetical protein
MMDKPRFTIRLSVVDNYGHESWHHAAGCDQVMSISSRAVNDLKMGFLGSLDATVKIMRTREFRRDALIEAAKILAAQMADRLEDAEGWHDPSRIEPARRALREG